MPQNYLGEVAEKSAGPAPDVQAPDASAPRPEQLVHQAPVALCRLDVAQCGAQSCAAAVSADGMARLEWRSSLLLELPAVPVPRAESSLQLEPQLALQEVSQASGGRAAQTLAVRQPGPATGQRAALEQKMWASA